MRLGLDKLNEDKFTNAKFILSRTNGRFPVDQVLTDNGLVVSGLITNEIVLSGGNHFTSPLEDSSMVQKILKSANILKTGLNLVGGNAGGQVASLSKNQSMLFYTGSEKPVFNLEAAFITTNATDIKNTALYKVNKVMHLVYPTGREILTAPLGYSPTLNAATVKGTISLRVGNWFHARNLVVRSASFSMSQEVTQQGEPLYGVGSIALEPYRAISYDEYMSWFRSKK